MQTPKERSGALIPGRLLARNRAEVEVEKGNCRFDRPPVCVRQVIVEAQRLAKPAARGFIVGL